MARSPLHEVWDRICEVEGVPRGAKQIKRLGRLVRDIDGLLSFAVQLSEPRREVFRLGVLAAMLAALAGPSGRR